MRTKLSSKRDAPPSVGILAFGSLLSDPGEELPPLIVSRIATQTPFPVEFGRLSGATRGGAPTLVPSTSGSPVNAEILVLQRGVTVEKATDMLYRREIRSDDKTKCYVRRNSPNSVRVEQLKGFKNVSFVIYTDFPPGGKLAPSDPTALAKAAIASVVKAEPGRDGISYLISASQAGIETCLTGGYISAILEETKTASLSEALQQTQQRLHTQR